MACPSCSSTQSRARSDLGVSIRECSRCRCIFGDCYLGDSYAIVRPWMTTDKAADARQVPFDLTTLGSQGLGRRHGFYDPETRLMTQAG